MDSLYETNITPQYVDGVKEWLGTDEDFLKELKAGHYDGIFKELEAQLKTLPRKSEEEIRTSDERFMSFIESQYNAFRQKYPNYEVDLSTFYGALMSHPSGRQLIETFIGENR